jgi:hypothetical protein
MTDDQMDRVVAGQNSQANQTCTLVSCVQVSVDNNQVQVAVPVAAAVSVLSSGPTTATQAGNITQRR